MAAGYRSVALISREFAGPEVPRHTNMQMQMDVGPPR